jgi:hypothetical protein
MDLEKMLVLEHSELPTVKYRGPFRWRVATLSLLETGKNSGLSVLLKLSKQVSLLLEG